MDSWPPSSSSSSVSSSSRQLHHNHTAPPSKPPQAIAARDSSRTVLQGLGASHNNIGAPPSTPPPRASRLDKSTVPATTSAPPSRSPSTVRQSYLDNDDDVSSVDDGPTTPAADHANNRPLSWSSVTRDSVVDNLLLSFDRMPGLDAVSSLQGPSAYSSFDDQFDSAATPPRVGYRPNQRPRGHTYSSSLSTDISTIDDAASYYSRNLSSRGKRSNSGSSFMGSPTRVTKIRDGRATTLMARNSAETQRTARKDLQSRGSNNNSNNNKKKGGKGGSAASSFDYGHGFSQIVDRVGGRMVARSPSRDNEFTQSAPEIANMSSNSILSRGRPVPSLFSAYEPPAKSAGGLRSDSDGLAPSTNPSTGAALLHNPQSQSGSAAQGDASQNAGAFQEIPQSIREQASDFVRATNMRTASPHLDQSGFAPAGGMQTHITANDASTAAAQHRPGFFRRVFGASNRSSSGTDVSKQLSRESSLTTDTPLPPRQKSTTPTATAAVTAAVASHTASQAKQETKTAKSGSAGPNAVVNKKPSFFRRRKKSVTDENMAPPILPQNFLNSSTRATEAQGPPSPGASSLRKVLDRYLTDTEVSTPPSGQVPLSRFAVDGGDGDTDSLDMFHSGYTPPPDATLRRTAPHEHRSSVPNKAPPAAATEPIIAPTPKTPTEADRLQAIATQKDDNLSSLQQTNSFLSDASEPEVRNKAPSIISAVSDTYNVPDDEESFAPVSPMISPTSDVPPNDSILRPSSTTQSDFGRILPGASIRAVASKFGGLASDRFSTITKSKGLAVNLSRSMRDDSTQLDATANSSSISLPLVETPRTLEPSPMQKIADLERKGSVPVVEVNGNEVRPSVDIARHLESVTKSDPNTEDMDRAKKIYTGEEEFVSKLQAAAWLGEKTQISARTLTAYMTFFDWAGQNILSSMRSLCGKLVLKGESQQVDRILEAFAMRWNECNPNNGFKGLSVIHNICYALLLLNTDLHVANIQHKMTRSEFIKNTMPAVKDAAEKTVKDNRQNSRPSIPRQDSTNSSDPNSPIVPPPSTDEPEERTSSDFKRSMKRLSLRPGVSRYDTDPGSGTDINNYASNILISYGWEGSERGWLLEVETVLKSFYTSILADALPLHGASDAVGSPTNNLSVSTSVLRRTGSVISKAPSEGFSYRGRKVSDTQSLAHRMHSKNRLRQKVYPASTVGSSRNSFDDGNSMLSPTGSSMWSRISTGKTQPTMSVESFALTNDFKQSLGFTNALSQAIIREEHEATSDSESFHRVGSLLEDESLELAGAPWAKEGMAKHKHHLEGPDRKAKERSWNECFAVVEKGYLHLFSFNRPTTKISSKLGSSVARARRNTTSAKTPGNKTPSVTPSVVGGGNWTDNAEELGQFLLRQTIATTLPAPGYSKARPHVWALSLPTGAVHLFQVGTAEIAEEFASTANYWSARLSKEPLVGGVDNIEYGWSEHILNLALLNNPNPSPPPSRGGGGGGGAKGHSVTNSLSTLNNMPRPSTQSSIRTSFDQSFGGKPRLPGDRAIISDWRPPASSMLPSQLLEIDQLRSLKAYITSVEAELEKHNELRHAIPLAYSNSSGARLGKVMANWEKKSSYLLKEVVKFRTYIEALEKAGARREQVYEERRIREEENAAAKMPAVVATA